MVSAVKGSASMRPTAAANSVAISEVESSARIQRLPMTGVKMPVARAESVRALVRPAASAATAALVADLSLGPNPLELRSHREIRYQHRRHDGIDVGCLGRVV